LDCGDRFESDERDVEKPSSSITIVKATSFIGGYSDLHFKFFVYYLKQSKYL
jgi:hypothetical protein